MRLLFHLAHSTARPERAAAALRTALACAEAGHEVDLWLADEGVRLGVLAVAETLRDPGPPTATEAIEGLVARGGRLHCPRPCFEGRGFERDQLRAGAILAEPADLAALLADGWVAVPG